MISQESTTKDVKLFGYDFRGHTRGTLEVGIAYGYPYYKGSAIFSLVFFQVPQVKNRLFPTNSSPLCKPLRIVFGQKSCPAGEYLQLKNKKIKID